MAEKSKVISKKKSKTNEKLFSILSKISNDLGGTVAYYFVVQRINNATGEIFEQKSILHTKISPGLFEKEINGRIYKRSYAEMVEILQDTCEDLGATYYRIN